MFPLQVRPYTCPYTCRCRYTCPTALPELDHRLHQHIAQRHQHKVLQSQRAEDLPKLNVIGISASPMAFPLRGHGRSGTQNDRLSEAVILSTSMPYPRNGHAVGDADVPA